MKDKVRVKRQNLLSYLLDCSPESRRKILKRIEKGEVTVNNQKHLNPSAKIDPIKDVVKLKGKIMQPLPKGALLFYKPPEVVSTRKDPQNRRTVYDFLPSNFQHYDISGRLDYWSTGLMILTNDGEITQVLTHPRYHVEKEYLVKVSGYLEDKDCEKLKKGTLIDGKLVRFHATEIIERKDRCTWAKVVLKSGQNRVIRKAFDKLFHPVKKLCRTRIWYLTLGKLKPGQFRHLTLKEYEDLKRKALDLKHKIDAKVKK